MCQKKQKKTSSKADFFTQHYKGQYGGGILDGNIILFSAWNILIDSYIFSLISILHSSAITNQCWV